MTDLDLRPIPNEPPEVPPGHDHSSPRPEATAPAAPHSLEAEAALLGAMLLSRDAIETAAGTITADAFYKPTHGHIYTAIVDLHHQGQAADPITVAEQLRRNGLLDTIGGPATLLDLITHVPATTSAATYAHILAEHHLARLLLDTGHQLANDARTTGSPKHLLDTTLDTLGQLNPPAARTATTVADLLHDHLDTLEARCDHTGPQGIPTGWTDLDHTLGGLRPGQLAVIAGRPAMGKTAFAIRLALQAAHAGHPTLIVSLEMGAPELLDRILAAEAQVRHDSLRDGRITPRDWDRITNHLGQVADLPVTIEDNARATLHDIRRTARTTGARLIVIDYLQLMHTTSSRDRNREQEVAELSRGCKQLARDLDATVVALSQLNRQLEARQDKRPMMSDLRESGAIENDADIVIGLYRDEYYRPDSPDKGVLEALVLKQRAGATGTVRLHFDPAHQTIQNLARSAA